METKKQVLLVGASGGLGGSAIAKLCDSGWHIFAADINQELLARYGQVENITPVPVDITDADSVQAAFRFIAGRTTGLDAIVHMAGVLKVGSVAELPVSELENALDINLLGVYRINRQFLPLLLQRKGRIIILSSEVGRQTAAPFNGVYAISKHALEAYSDALRRELSVLGVKVIKIQPGPFKTDMTGKTIQLFEEAREDSAYFKENLAKGITYLPKVYRNAHDPVHVAHTVMRALNSRNPRTAYPVKTDLIRMILDFLPVKWADRLIQKALS